MEATHTASLENKSQVTKSWTCYSSTKDITCHLFWNCIIDGNLNRLIVGEISQEEKESEETKEILAQAWNDILIEHAETINDDATNNFQSVLDIEVRQARINWVATTVLYLKKEYHEELSKRLKSYFRVAGVQLDISDPFQFQRDLDRCLAVSKTWQFELTKQRDILEETFGNKGEKEPVSYKSFNRTLIYLNKHFGGERLNAKTLTVYDYDTMFSEMINEINKNK